MSLFAETDPRFRGLPLKVLAFVLLGIAASSMLLFTLAARQGYFQPKTELRLEAASGSGLAPGMAVKLSGFKIGEVRSVALNERAQVDVVLRIEDRHLRWLKADSRAYVAREGLIGDSFLAVTGGSAQLAPLRQGESLLFEENPALADIAADLRSRTLPVIDGMTELLGYLNRPDGDFRVAFANLRALSGELRETRRQLDRLLADLDRLAREDGPRTLGTIDSEVRAMSARVDASLTQLDEASRRAAGAIDSASPRLDRLLEDADAAARDARKLMDGASKRWLFRGGRSPDAAEPTPP